VPWEYEGWIGIVQRCPTPLDFLATIGIPSTPDRPATEEALMLYSRMKNAIATADNDYKTRDQERSLKK
jgi:hypothetical protein